MLLLIQHINEIDIGGLEDNFILQIIATNKNVNKN